jgi:hypothetical protein
MRSVFRLITIMLEIDIVCARQLRPVPSSCPLQVLVRDAVPRKNTSMQCGSCGKGLSGGGRPPAMCGGCFAQARQRTVVSPRPSSCL